MFSLLVLRVDDAPLHLTACHSVTAKSRTDLTDVVRRKVRL